MWSAAGIHHFAGRAAPGSCFIEGQVLSERSIIQTTKQKSTAMRMAVAANTSRAIPPEKELVFPVDSCRRFLLLLTGDKRCGAAQ